MLLRSTDASVNSVILDVSADYFYHVTQQYRQLTHTRQEYFIL